MKIFRSAIVVVSLLLLTTILAGCVAVTPAGPCEFTTNMPVTIYRKPDGTSALFGTMSTAETYKALAQTADGWVGFDPGYAQAGNIGLAHHRWVQLNATFSPSCLDSVDLVTLEEVEADIALSNP